MEFDYLKVRCGPYHVLVPGANVARIEQVPNMGQSHLSLRRARQKGGILIIDGRTLLGLNPPVAAGSHVVVHWSLFGEPVGAALVVDGVDGLRSGYEAEFLPLPRVPWEFSLLFDGLIHTPGSPFMLRLRKNIVPPLETPADRRRFCRSFIGVDAPSDITRAA